MSTSDYSEILDDPAVDAVYIATPFATHHPMALLAIKAGDS